MSETHVVHIVAARPNFMKAAPVIHALAGLDVRQRIIHTGQHYDDELSAVFFEDLAIPRPHVNLGVGSGSHAEQTAAVMVELEKVLVDLRPDPLVVYGDVNSTVAAGLVAAKARIPLAHVEAGLRSFDLSMPEEINRRVTDCLADLHFVTSPEAIANLADEGVPSERIEFVGNPMIDTLVTFRARVDPTDVLRSLSLEGDFGLVTMHRPANVDDPSRAERIVEALDAASERLSMIVPLHPRGAETLRAAGLHGLEKVRVVEPLGYADFLGLLTRARVVITDSGGIQEETTILGVPCLTVRPNTERPITVTWGTNQLVEPEDIPRAVDEVLGSPDALPESRTPPLWDGRAGERIAARLAAFRTPNR